LTEDELMSKSEKVKHKTFDAKVHEVVLGDAFKLEDFKDDLICWNNV
jgi:hypothetical protein